MPHTVLEDLLEKVQKEKPVFTAPQQGESEDAFLRRLVSATSELIESNWNALSEASQAWYNAAAAAINAIQTIPSCPGYQLVVALPSSGDGVSPTAETGASSTKAAAVISGTTTKGKRGIMQRTREIAVQYPDWDYLKVTELLKTEGWPVTGDTVWNCCMEVKNVLKAAETVGKALVSVGTVVGANG